jgi:hypothetical protein
MLLFLTSKHLLRSSSAAGVKGEIRGPKFSLHQYNQQLLFKISVQKRTQGQVDLEPPFTARSGFMEVFGRKAGVKN